MCSRVRERGRAGGAGRFRRPRLPAGDGRGGRGGHATATRAATCPTATAPPTLPRPTASSTARSRRLDVVRELDAAGFTDVAEAVLGMQRQRVSADYLQTSAIIDARRHRPLGGQRPEPLRGPGHGLSPRGRALGAAAAAAVRARPGAKTVSPNGGLSPVLDNTCCHCRRGAGRGRRSRSGRRSATRSARRSTACRTRTCSRAVADGVREGGAAPRLVRVRRVSDVAFIGHDGAKLSGSGIAIGLQSKGTAVIHRADLEPLDNLELFGMSPLYSLDSYRAMGRNAAAYARGAAVGPGADRAGQLRPREADRADDAPPRARDRGRRARAPRRSSSSSP